MKMRNQGSPSSSSSISSSSWFRCVSLREPIIDLVAGAGMFSINSSTSSEKEMVAEWFVNTIMMPCDLLHRQLDRLRAKQERKIQHQKYEMMSLFRKLASREKKLKKGDDERSAFNQLLATATGMPASVFAVFDHFEDNDISPAAKGESALPKASQPVPGATTSSTAAADADAADATDAAASAMDSDFKDSMNESDCKDCGKHHPGEKECCDDVDESSPDDNSESEHDADHDHDAGDDKDSTAFKFKVWNRENVKNYKSLLRATNKLSSCARSFKSRFDSPSSIEWFSELASKRQFASSRKTVAAVTRSMTASAGKSLDAVRGLLWRQPTDPKVEANLVEQEEALRQEFALWEQAQKSPCNATLNAGCWYRRVYASLQKAIAYDADPKEIELIRFTLSQWKRAFSLRSVGSVMADLSSAAELLSKDREKLLDELHSARRLEKWTLTSKDPLLPSCLTTRYAGKDFDIAPPPIALPRRSSSLSQVIASKACKIFKEIVKKLDHCRLLRRRRREVAILSAEKKLLKKEGSELKRLITEEAKSLQVEKERSSPQLLLLKRQQRERAAKSKLVHDDKVARSEEEDRVGKKGNCRGQPLPFSPLLIPKSEMKRQDCVISSLLQMPVCGGLADNWCTQLISSLNSAINPSLFDKRMDSLQMAPSRRTIASHYCAVEMHLLKRRIAASQALTLRQLELLAEAAKMDMTLVFNTPDGRNRSVTYNFIRQDSMWSSNFTANLVVNINSDTSGHARPASSLELELIKAGKVPIASPEELALLADLLIGGGGDDDDDDEMDSDIGEGGVEDEEMIGEDEKVGLRKKDRRVHFDLSKNHLDWPKNQLDSPTKHEPTKHNTAVTTADQTIAVGILKTKERTQKFKHKHLATQVQQKQQQKHQQPATTRTIRYYASSSSSSYGASSSSNVSFLPFVQNRSTASSLFRPQVPHTPEVFEALATEIPLGTFQLLATAIPVQRVATLATTIPLPHSLSLATVIPVQHNAFATLATAIPLDGPSSFQIPAFFGNMKTSKVKTATDSSSRMDEDYLSSPSLLRGPSHVGLPGGLSHGSHPPGPPPPPPPLHPHPHPPPPPPHMDGGANYYHPLLNPTSSVDGKPRQSHVERHRIQADLLKHQQRTMGLTFRKLFAAALTISRGDVTTNEEFLRKNRALAVARIPGCSIASAPKGRNGGGKLGGWTIIHVAAAALDLDPKAVHIKLSLFLAQAAIATRRSEVRNALMRFLTPLCHQTADLLRTNGLAPISPGDCFFPPRDTHTPGASMEEESVTRTVEHLIGQALVASYSQTRVHITRYADLSTCAELETRLLAIADAQSKTTDLIISIVREGDNSYAGALVKRGALADRRERDQRFLASAVAAAEKAKAAFDAAQICRCNKSLGDGEICGSLEECVCKSAGLLCVPVFCGCFANRCANYPPLLLDPNVCSYKCNNHAALTLETTRTCSNEDCKAVSHTSCNSNIEPEDEWLCKNCVRYSLANVFDDELKRAHVLYELLVESLSDRPETAILLQDPSLLFVAEEWKLWIVNEANEAFNEDRMKKDILKEKAKAQKQLKGQKEELKKLKEATAAAKKLRVAEEKILKEKATLQSSLDRDIRLAGEAAALSEADRLKREGEGALSVNDRWRLFFENKFEKAAEVMQNIFNDALDGARSTFPGDSGLFVSGSTSNLVAGLITGKTNDIDVYIDWGDRESIQANLQDLSTWLHGIALTYKATVKVVFRSFDFKTQPPPFGKANSGYILDATFTLQNGSSPYPLILQFLPRNPAWTPGQIIDTFWGSHKQSYHLWNKRIYSPVTKTFTKGSFTEHLSDSALQSLREKETYFSPVRMMQIVGQCVKRLSLSAKATDHLIVSIVRTFADSLDPAKSPDGDRNVVKLLRDQFLKKGVPAEMNDPQVIPLRNLLLKRNPDIQKRISAYKEDAPGKAADLDTLYYLSHGLRDLTYRVYKDSVNGQLYNWQESLLNISSYLRDPLHAASISLQLGNVFTPQDLSFLINNSARRAPDAVGSKRVDSRPLPANTRPGARETFMTTVKQSIHTSVRGTEVERNIISERLRLEAQNMSRTVPFAYMLVLDALLHSMKHDREAKEELIMGEKLKDTPRVKQNLARVLEQAMTDGLRRVKTKGNAGDKPEEEEEEGGYSNSPVMQASKRFFADQRNKNVVFPARTPGDSTLMHRQATFMAAEVARHLSLEKRGKLYKSTACLVRRTIINLSFTTHFAPADRERWFKFAFASNKGMDPIAQGLVDEALHIRAKGKDSTLFDPLKVVRDALVKKQLIKKTDPIPPFLVNIAKSYGDVFWGGFGNLRGRKDDMRHSELKQLLCEGNNKVTMVGRLYHHVLGLTESWLSELPGGLKQGPGTFVANLTTLADPNEAEDVIDNLEEGLHKGEDEEMEELDVEIDVDDAMDEANDDNDNDPQAPPLPPTTSAAGALPPPPALFDPFKQGLIHPMIKTPLWGKKFYPKAFSMLPKGRLHIRSIGVEASFVSIAFKDLDAVKAVKEKEAFLRKNDEDVAMHYMNAVFDRPKRKKETYGASVVTNGYYCSILYDKVGYIPEDDEKKPFFRDPNKPFFHRHRDAERFPRQKDASDATARHWRRVVSCDPGKRNILTCLEILADGSEHVTRLTAQQYKHSTDYFGRVSRAKKRCRPLMANPVVGPKGAFIKLSQPEAWGKTADYNKYATHMSVMASVADEVFAETLLPYWAHTAFNSWQSKQQCLDRFWSNVKAGSLAHGTFNVQPIIAYGDGQFASSGKGRVSAPTTACFKSCLKINYSENVCLTTEHRSTYTCASCEKPLQNLLPGNVTQAAVDKEAQHWEDIRRGRKNPKTRFSSPYHQVLKGLKRCVNSLCPNALHSFVDRDVNACMNIMRAFHYADQHEEDPESPGPVRPPHMDPSRKAFHSVERKNAPRNSRLATQTHYIHKYGVPHGPGHTDRHEARVAARKQEAYEHDTIAPLTGPSYGRRNLFPTTPIDNFMGGGSWRADRWTCGEDNSPSPPPSSTPPHHPPSYRQTHKRHWSTQEREQPRHTRSRLTFLSSPLPPPPIFSFPRISISGTPPPTREEAQANFNFFFQGILPVPTPGSNTQSFEQFGFGVSPNLSYFPSTEAATAHWLLHGGNKNPCVPEQDHDLL